MNINMHMQYPAHINGQVCAGNKYSVLHIESQIVQKIKLFTHLPYLYSDNHQLTYSYTQFVHSRPFIFSAHCVLRVEWVSRYYIT